MEIFIYLIVGAIILFVVVKMLGSTDQAMPAPPPPLTRNHPSPIRSTPPADLEEEKPKRKANRNQLEKDFAKAEFDQNPYFLFLQIKAAGRPKDFNAPPFEIENWPKPVHIGWLVFNQREQLIEEKDYYFIQNEPLSDKIKEELFIDDDFIDTMGEESSEIFEELNEVALSSIILIAHNLEYQISVLDAEAHRMAIPELRLPRNKYCLMKKGTEYCKIEKPSGYGYKWPTMDELIATVFQTGEKPSEYRRPDPDSALEDARMMAKCYFRMNKK